LGSDVCAQTGLAIITSIALAGARFFVGGWGWGGFPDTAASEPILVGDSAPVIINIGVDPAQGDAPSAVAGGCVIHKLKYDRNGEYVGER
jgi:hypothetical protein